MRYRVLSRGKAKHLSIPEKPAEKTASLKAADLDNPYGRVFGTPAAGKTCANKQERPLRLICTPNSGHPGLGVFS